VGRVAIRVRPRPKKLDLHVGFARGSRFACPACGAEGCSVHDVREKEWRHLNFFQHKTVLKASIPRVTYDKCGIKQVSPPWGPTGSGSTLRFEAFLHSMVKAMPVANVAEIVDEHDTRIWRVLDHYVSQAVDRLDLSEVEKRQPRCDKSPPYASQSRCAGTAPGPDRP
jgi:transposase